MFIHFLFALILQTTPVGTVALKDVAFTPQPDAPASVLARNESELSSEIRAVVRVLHVDVGTTVVAGDVLVSLDCRSYRLSERTSRAQLAALFSKASLAERRVDRARALRASETVSEELFDSRTSEWSVLLAELEAANAALELARLDVEHCEVRAPFAGVVTQRSAQAGQFVEPGAPMLTLVETEGRRVAAQLSVRLVPTLAEAVHLRFVSAEGETPLRLKHVVPVVDPRSRSQEVRLVPLDEGLALPGTSGRLVWDLVGTAVPAHLLVRREAGLGLFLYEPRGPSGVAVFHLLSEAEEGRPAEVDLPADTLLITEGRLGLEAGDSVKAR